VRCTLCAWRRRSRAGHGLRTVVGFGVTGIWLYAVSAISSPTQWTLQGERSGAKRFLAAAIGTRCRRWFRQFRTRTRTPRRCCHHTCTDNVRSAACQQPPHGSLDNGHRVSNCYHHAKAGSGCGTCNGWLCANLSSRTRCIVYRCTTNSNSLSSCYSKTIGLSSTISNRSRPISSASVRAGAAD
jgi:hypothetical protein